MIAEQIKNASDVYDYYKSNVKVYEQDDDFSGVGCDIGIRVRSSGHLLFVSNNSRKLTSFSSDRQVREDITQFSANSAIRMRRYLRECLPVYTGFLTLTYPEGFGFGGGKAKRDLKVFMQRLKRYIGVSAAHSFSAFWFMEFQKRGSIHFHMFVSHRIDKHWLSKTWYDIVGSEDKRHLQAGTNICSIRSGRHGTCAYASKYAAKHAQKKPPPEVGWVGRFWGVSGDRTVVSAATFVSVESWKVNAVKRKVKMLDNLLEDAVFAGKARIIQTTRDNFIMYHLMDDKTSQIMLNAVRMIGLSTMLYAPKHTHHQWPELDGDLADA